MDKKTLFLWITIALLAGAVLQKIVWGGALSTGLIIMAIASGWCAFKAPRE